MTDAAITALVRAFEDCSLPKADWTHSAHLTVALTYLRRFGREEATRRMRSGLQRYNGCVGTTGLGYHETITLAWVAVVADFLLRHDCRQPLAELARDLVAACGDKHFLRRYYSDGVLLSEAARRDWVPPDRRPFDPAADWP